MEETKRKNQRELHAKALKGIVTANGFFTAAVLIGITNTVSPSPGIPRPCVPGDDISRNLFLFEVFSFCFYLASSLIAQGMNLAIAHLQAIDPKQERVQIRATTWIEQSPPSSPAPPDVEEQRMPWWAAAGRSETKEAKELRWFRRIMMSSVAFSVLGSFFLLLAMIDVVQLKVGLLSCGSTAALAAAAAAVLALFVSAGLAVYVFVVVYALKQH